MSVALAQTSDEALVEFSNLATAEPAHIELTQQGGILPERYLVATFAVGGAPLELAVGSYKDFPRWRRLVELAGPLRARTQNPKLRNGRDPDPFELPLVRARADTGDEIAVVGRMLAQVIALRVKMPENWMP